MQGLVDVGLIVEEIWNVDVKCLKVTGAGKIGQGHRVKVPVGCYTEEKHYARFCLIVEEILNVDVK